MTVFWSFNFIVGKLTLHHVSVMALAPFRILFAGLILLAIYLASPHRAKINRQDLGVFALLGFFGVAINQVFFTIGLNFTTAGHSSLIVGAAPILVLLVGYSMGIESLTAAKVSGMCLSLAGVAILATEHGLSLRSANLEGDLITFAGSIGFAFYAVFGKRVAGRYDSVAMNTFNTLFASILLLPWGVYEAVHLDWRAVGWQGWAGMFYMAAFSSVFGYVVFYWALRYLAASRVSAFSYFQPLLVNVLGVVVLGEHLTKRLLWGGAMILVGVYMTERGLGER